MTSIPWSLFFGKSHPSIFFFRKTSCPLSTTTRQHTSDVVCCHSVGDSRSARECKVSHFQGACMQWRTPPPRCSRVAPSLVSAPKRSRARISGAGGGPPTPCATSGVAGVTCRRSHMSMSTVRAPWIPGARPRPGSGAAFALFHVNARRCPQFRITKGLEPGDLPHLNV